jgi:hypothetical protein
MVSCQWGFSCANTWIRLEAPVDDVSFGGVKRGVEYGD